MREANADPSLFITNGENERLKDKAVYFIRNLPEGKKSVELTESNDNQVIFGELSPNILQQLNNTLDMGYQPMIELIPKPDWGSCE